MCLNEEVFPHVRGTDLGAQQYLGANARSALKLHDFCLVKTNNHVVFAQSGFNCVIYLLEVGFTGCGENQVISIHETLDVHGVISLCSINPSPIHAVQKLDTNSCSSELPEYGLKNGVHVEVE
jgi:hypothetical protein